MDQSILKPEIQDFINSHINSDITRLTLSKNPFPDLVWQLILSQISAKAKAKTKLPLWFETPGIYYPTKVSVEQTSSEITAKYKASIVFGESLIDLTGGFGVDDYYFSQKIRSVTHCEINPELSEIATHNFGKLKANINCIAGDSNEILKGNKEKFDWIYIDPSRRNESKGKVFMLQDCLPDVPKNLDFYFSKADNILIKTAPLLDLSAGLSELHNVRSIHIVALKNEVKELLWILSTENTQEIEIKTINIGADKNETFSFLLNQPTIPTYSLPKVFLYEPNAAIMKSGGFAEIGVAFNLAKLHSHSHLYTSDKLTDFPGRTFSIDQIIPYNKSGMKQLADIRKANITVRNFPETVDKLRKKHKIEDGGSIFCFFTTDINDNKIALICTKLN